MKKTHFPFYLLIAIVSCTNKEVTENKTHVNIDLNERTETPELFAKNIISTNMNERDLAISLKGDEIIYTLGNFNSTKRALVHLKKREDDWSAAEILPFSGVYQDIEPFFHPDGTKLFFASTRPINGDSSRSDYNIWYAERNDSGYGQPTDLGSIINSDSDEFYPSVSKNGNLYFTATYDYGIGSEDIFVSRFENGIYQKPVPLDSAINTKTYEFNAYISPEEDLIIFSSYGRADDMGGGDLYISQKDSSGNWMQSRNLGNSINSSSLDYCPFIDLPRSNFYFTSNHSAAGKKIENIVELKKEYEIILNGLGNIYRVDMATILSDENK